MGDLDLKPRLCTIRKWADFPGYGFNLHAERGRAGQYIGKVDDGSPAQAAGMKEGDRIVEIEGTNIGNENHSQVVNRIKAAGDSVTMLLVDSETDKHYKEEKVVVSSDMSDVVRIETPPRPGPEDDKDDEKPESDPPSEPPSYNDVQEADQEADQEDETPKPDRAPTPEPVPVDTPSHNYHPRLCLIRKWADFQGYGFNLHAEKDKKGQYIGLVDANSPAEDADLRKGDRIIEINGENIEDESHQQVIQKIKAGGDQTKMLVVDPEADEYYKNNGIKITPDLPEVIFNQTREKEVSERSSTPEPVSVPETSESHNFHPRLCHIKKWPDFQGYGFNLHAEKEKNGQYIGLIDANSPAEDADLRKGDRIVEVNGENIERDTHQQIIQKIKAGGDETRLLVVDSDADDYYRRNGIQIKADMPEVVASETRQKEVPAMTFHPRQCHVIKWPDFQGYGFNLHAEKERGGQYIGKIDENSPAEDAGLRENDRIIEVNNANIENETHQQVIARIKAGGDETKLLVVDKEADAYYKSRGITVTSQMPEVEFRQTARRSNAGTKVTNGDSAPASVQAPQQTRSEPAVQKSEPAQANGGDFLNLSAKEMRERIAQKKKNDPKQKSNMDFRSKFEIFQKM
ncbi:Na(+)/H(+) exchange regulatory cofactor NHE-RF1-like isoform X1 [Ruditapes philippinarum]|uniref:Na(+)/H(+) exchange regulatory cofactor NHE-RF1-like isoform X1 n=1 Tax=Ruditapes philippinarum TaxID=129788 RepID=UPI00295A9418|nr:Na(+)/H(+) exchange regulatory cofactor NHE-RF1-like isoform X1 [Ruditapes philippinarum]